MFSSSASCAAGSVRTACAMSLLKPPSGRRFVTAIIGATRCARAACTGAASSSEARLPSARAS